MATKRRILSDGVITSTWTEQPHEGKTYVEHHQDTTAIEQRNHELRKNPDALRDLEFGRQVASIPLVVYYQWMRDYPELKDKDPLVRNTKFMELVKQHPQYWVREKI